MYVLRISHLESADVNDFFYILTHSHIRRHSAMPQQPLKPKGMQEEAVAATEEAEKHCDTVFEAANADTMVASIEGLDMVKNTARLRKWSADVYGARQVQDAAREIQMRSLLAGGSDDEAMLRAADNDSTRSVSTHPL